MAERSDSGRRYPLAGSAVLVASIVLFVYSLLITRALLVGVGSIALLLAVFYLWRITRALETLAFDDDDPASGEDDG